MIIESSFLPKTENIKIQQNTTWNEAWDFFDGDEDFDVSDCVPVIQVEDKAGETILEILLLTGLSISGNRITVFKEIELPIAKHKWQLQAVLSSGYIIPVRAGYFDVRKNLIS